MSGLLLERFHIIKGKDPVASDVRRLGAGREPDRRDDDAALTCTDPVPAVAYPLCLHDGREQEREDLRGLLARCAPAASRSLRPLLRAMAEVQRAAKRSVRCVWRRLLSTFKRLAPGPDVFDRVLCEVEVRAGPAQSADPRRRGGHADLRLVRPPLRGGPAPRHARGRRVLLDRLQFGASGGAPRSAHLPELRRRLREDRRSPVLCWSPILLPRLPSGMAIRASGREGGRTEPCVPPLRSGRDSATRRALLRLRITRGPCAPPSDAHARAARPTFRPGQPRRPLPKLPHEDAQPRGAHEPRMGRRHP